MGNGGAKPYTPPPPEPVPIEDSIAARHNAMKANAEMSSRASTSANDLNEDTMDNGAAITRSQIAKGEVFAPQARPTGPAGGHRRPRAPGSLMIGSTVLTG